LVRRRVGFLAALSVALFSLIGISQAHAGEEARCAKQYSLEEHLILEWAAIGGDPHAQFALAQCALPDGPLDLSDAEKTYAVKWVTLAACDAREDGTHAFHDRLTRRLKEQGDLSFRRFAGVEADDDDLNRREKRFVRYRDRKSRELMDRFERLEKTVDEAHRARARVEIADDFARLGRIGLMRLAELSECDYFGASETFAAAVWDAAAAAWSDEAAGAIYGRSARRDAAPQEESRARAEALSPAQWRTFAYERARLDQYAPERLARLEEEAALGRLSQLRTLEGLALESGPESGALLVAEPIADTSFDGPSVTLATQYALEALGFMEFVNGPDNDYGPSTIEAVARAQASYGKTETRWLSHDDVRQMVCDAAVGAGDPVSYYHLGVMFQRGWGFRSDLARARYAMNEAARRLDARLAADDDLEAWKRRAYPAFRTEVDAAAAAIDEAWNALPAVDKNAAAAWDPAADTLCRP